MFRSLLAVAAAVVLTLSASLPAHAVPATAAELLDAKVDYTANYYLNSSNGTFHGEVIHAPGRERREFSTSGGHQTLLLRRDIDEATMMWPERKWYVSTSFQALAGLIGGFDGVVLDRKPSGRDVIAGEQTTRYDVTAAAGQAGSFAGQMWFTRDGILMKAKGQVAFQGREIPVETGLLNLRRIKADPAAFVRPSDYKGLPLDISKLGLR